jgi:hypothetical protein
VTTLFQLRPTKGLDTDNQIPLHSTPATTRDIHSEKSKPTDKVGVNPQTTSDTTSSKKTKVVFGASNCCGLDLGNDNAIVVAESGASAGNIDMLLKKIDEMNLSAKNIEIAILHLGTNDMKIHKNDTEQVELNITDAVLKIRETFPNPRQIRVSSIPPKKGVRDQTMRYSIGQCHKSTAS